MVLAILGANGQVGKSLYDVFKSSEHTCFFYTKEELDICDKYSFEKMVVSNKPDFIINTAAFTQVDEAETETKRAFLINEVAVKGISEVCRKMNVHLIHISTDYVFDGEKKGYYNENDNTNPQSIYGISKYNGEQAIKESNCSHTIIRTAWVFGEYGNNFLKTMIKLSSKNEISIVNDQIGCPTYAIDIACAIEKIINHEYLDNIYGTFHFAGNISVSWYEFAEYIFQEAKKLNLIDDIPIVKKIKTKDYFTKAKRPLNSRLDSSRINKLINAKPSNWQMGVRITLETIKLKGLF